MLFFRNISPTILILGLLGSVPFLILAVVINYSVISEGDAASSEILGIYAPSIFVNYSAIILAFLSGTLWGSRDKIRNSKEQTSLLVFTNLMAISAWLLIIASHLSNLLLLISVLLLGVAFFVIYLMEVFYLVIPPGYKAFRRLLTLIVIISHFSLFIGLSWS